MFEKCKNGFGHFSAPGNCLNFPKNPNIDIWVPKMCFSKMYIFRAPLNWRGLVWYLLSLSKSHAPRGLDKHSQFHDIMTDIEK